MFLWLLLLSFGITSTIFIVYVATSILSPVQYLFCYLLDNYKSFNAITIERCLCVFFVSCYPFFQWLVAALGIGLQGDQLKVFKERKKIENKTFSLISVGFIKQIVIQLWFTFNTIT